MFKKFLVPLLILSMVFFYECKDDHILPDQDQTALKKGKGGGGQFPEGNHDQKVISRLQGRFQCSKEAVEVPFEFCAPGD